MTDITVEIRQLFDRYISAWNAHDLAGVAACYAEPSFFILPEASVSVTDRVAMIALLEELFASLEADGFSHSEIGDISARMSGQGLVVADAKDIKRLRKDGSLLEVIDAHYIIRKIDDQWLFTTALTCTPGWEDA